MFPLSYFWPQILLILFCIAGVRLAGLKQRQLGWIARSSRRWLGTWSLIGFAIAAILGVVAWIMNTDYVYGHAEWVWPFCLGLGALQGKPTTLETLMVLTILALENAILYFLLATIVGLAFHLIAKVSKPKTESLSIFGR